MAGHTYRYYNGEPLYPFGYGLSYTTFLYTSLTMSADTITGGQNITATVGVLNSGKFDADEVCDRCFYEKLLIIELFVGHGGALVKSMPFDRRIVGSNPALSCILSFSHKKTLLSKCFL